MKYWLMKSEPDVYSISHLKKKKKDLWDGVRNYQARNFMMKDMSAGDMVLFYHSSTQPPGVAGLAKITKEAVPDPSQFNKKSKYYDEKSTKEKPRWHCVEVGYVKTFPNYVPLEEIRNKKSLEKMLLIKKGMRLSIQPVSKKEYDIICKMGEA